MQSAEDWAAKNTPCPLYGARHGRILVQGQVRARLIIVASVRFQNPAQMCLAQDNAVCQSAFKFGSDSLLMKSERRLTLVSQRNQCDAASLTSVGPGSSRV